MYLDAEIPPAPNSFPKTKPPPKAGVPKTQWECDLVSTPLVFSLTS